MPERWRHRATATALKDGEAIKAAARRSSTTWTKPAGPDLLTKMRPATARHRATLMGLGEVRARVRPAAMDP